MSSQARQSKLMSSVLLEFQFVLFGSIARMSDGNHVRSLVLKPSTVELHDPPARRGRGRPCAVWTRELYSRALRA
eukprot:7587202-Pyramimonas_sp.AAC.1